MNDNQEQQENTNVETAKQTVETVVMAPKKDLLPHQKMAEKEVVIKRITLAEKGNWFGKDFNKDAERIRPRFVIECGHNGSVWNTGLTDEEEKQYSDLFKTSLSKYEPTSKPHPFYSKKENKLDLTDTLILNTSNPRDFLKFKLAQLDEKIAPSKTHFEDGTNPSATHYMYSTELEQKTVSENITRKAKAYSSLKEMGVNALRTVIEVFYNNTFEDASEIQLQSQYENAIEEDLNYLISILNKDELTRTYEATIIKALDKQVLQQYNNSDKVYYMEKMIGDSIQSAATYLKIPENQELYIKIKTKLNN